MEQITIEYLRTTYPEEITKDQFYRICHISKKTASYLLESGIVPCRNSGKKTRKYIDSVKDGYDYVLLDCRPSLGMLVINALSASDYVLVPVQAEYFAAEDMTELLGTVRQVKRQINPKLEVGGMLSTMIMPSMYVPVRRPVSVLMPLLRCSTAWVILLRQRQLHCLAES